jgi:hypothetical protein
MHAKRKGLTMRTVVHTLLVGLLTTPLAAHAQAVRLGVVMDEPRQQLAVTWDDANPRQVERAFCVIDWSFGVYHVSREPVQDDTVFRVFRIQSAEVTNATPVSAEFDCPDGVPELHVHTPTTCMGEDASTCRMGGLNAYSCQPSRGDYEKLVQRHDPFGVIQCDKRAFRFYYPSEYAAPPDPTLANRGPNSTNSNGNMTPAMRSAADAPQPGGGVVGGSGARAQHP